MRIGRRTLLVGLTSVVTSGCVSRNNDDDTTDANADTLYHVSTIDALQCGHFSDEFEISKILENGDWGLGTVNGVDGELAIVDGKPYAVRANGATDLLDTDVRTPFAAVTEFESDKSVELRDIEDFQQFGERIRTELPRTDHFYALRIEGTFDFLRTRSVDKQVKPYPTLADVVENERIFEFTDVEGDMPTFFIPDQFERIHPPGYHAHFVTADRDGGGHVYDFRADALTVEIDRLQNVQVALAEREVEQYPPC